MSIALDATGLNSDEWAVREQVLQTLRRRLATRAAAGA